MCNNGNDNLINSADDDDIFLPKISPKQNRFVRYYSIQGLNGIEAYRSAYNSSANAQTCYVEASRLLKNPKIALWIDYCEKNRKDYIKNEIKFSVDDAFKELDNMKLIALESTDKLGRPNVSAAIKACEMQIKIKGLLNEDAIVNNNVTVEMGNIQVDGEPLDLRIGETPNGGNDENKDKFNSSVDTEHSA